MRTGHRLNGAGPGSLCGLAVLQVDADTLRKPGDFRLSPAARQMERENRNEEPEATGVSGLGQIYLLRRDSCSCPDLDARSGAGAMGAARDRAGSQPAAAPVPLFRPGGRGPRRIRARFVLLA